MASFQAKIHWKRMRNEKTKNIVSFRPYPTRNRKFQKNSKKIQKIKKFFYGFISSQNRLEKAEKREQIKIIVPLRSYPTRNKKLQNNSKKVLEIIKIPLWLQFKPKQDGKGRQREKIKIIVPFLPDGLKKILKKQQKNFEKLKNMIMASFQAKIG